MHGALLILVIPNPSLTPHEIHPLLLSLFRPKVQNYQKILYAQLFSRIIY